MYAIVPEVCSLIRKVLGPKYLKRPSTADFRRIAEEFDELHFPHCIGAIDGRHCPIRSPKHSGSAFFNYKKFNSIVLMMAICDRHERFTMINLRGYGSTNDAFTLNNSDISEMLENDPRALPAPEMLPNSNTVAPFYLLGDGGFPLKSYLMKPYMKVRHMTPEMQVFNYRLSHARQTIECAFGRLRNQWAVNHTELAWKLETCEEIIHSTICLHNYKITMELRETRGFRNHWIDAPFGFVEQVDNVQVNFHFHAHQLRHTLSEYMVSRHGSVPWQWQHI
ncbi:protein ALP1-like [Trichogramma pretiosum]|uniref:protein ALP1-like n=1 Tax=Trichogramma pretiosum TaxID=7493 RepID=UPI0006C9D354|nr:protein ALP1-like [Trichogramma pretiosum]